MVMYEIHSHPVLQNYKAHVCSRASVFQVIIVVFTVLFPLLVAYASQGTDRKAKRFGSDLLVPHLLMATALGKTSMHSD